MPAALANAHIEGQARLRRLVEQALTATWNGLPGHDRENLDEWLSKVVPATLQGQRASASLTDAYIAQALGRGPIGIDPAEVIGAAVRNGAQPSEVYERPFITLWGGLEKGLSYEEAASKALARATSTGAMDVQLSMRATAEKIDAADRNLYGYRRVADAGACQFCKEVDGAYVKGSSGFVYALHNHCGCGLEPLTEPHKGAVTLPDGTEIRPYAFGPLNDNVAIADHGELGPVLVDPNQHFTGPNDL
jgi:hypothetical protein